MTFRAKIDAEEEADKAQAEAILATITLPAEIERTEVISKLDSIGDPALFVDLWVPQELMYSEETQKILHHFSEDIQTRMLAAGFSRFPYVSLRQAA